MSQGLVTRSLGRPDLGAKTAVTFDQRVHRSACGRRSEICCTAIGRQRRRRKERIAPREDAPGLPFALFEAQHFVQSCSRVNRGRVADNLPVLPASGCSRSQFSVVILSSGSSSVVRFRQSAGLRTGPVLRHFGARRGGGMGGLDFIEKPALALAYRKSSILQPRSSADRPREGVT